MIEDAEGSIVSASGSAGVPANAFTAAASGRPGPAVLLAPADLLTETAAARAALLRPRTLSLGGDPATPWRIVATAAVG